MTQTRNNRTSEQAHRRVASRRRSSSRRVQSTRVHSKEAIAKRKRLESERLQKKASAGEDTRKHKRKKKKRGIGGIFLIVLVVLAILGGLGYLAVVLFQLKQINVTNNQFTSDEEVIGWISQDKYSTNTLYVWWRYNHSDLSDLPTVESVHVKIESMQKVTVEVTEKTFGGRIDMDGEFLYFDKNGIVSYKSADVVDGVPLIGGIEAEAQKVQMGKALPVSDKSIFGKLEEISDLLAQNGLKPDKIEIAEKDLALWFGGVKILLGEGRYAPRMEQIPPILAKINELYPGQNGVLHLENYEQGTEFIRFEPARE